MSGPFVAAQFDGLKQLSKAVKNVQGDSKLLTQANKEAATIAARAARTYAPVGQTGRLANSIRAGGTTKAGTVKAGNNTTIPYANPIHWGWPSRHQKAQPFASIGAKASQPTWLPIYENRIEEILKQIADEVQVKI